MKRRKHNNSPQMRCYLEKEVEQAVRLLRERISDKKDGALKLKEQYPAWVKGYWDAYQDINKVINEVFEEVE